MVCERPLLMLYLLMYLKVIFYSRKPEVAIGENGEIFITRCTCPVKNGGRCCHIAALFFLLDDISLGRQPRLRQSTTDKLCYWKQGTAKSVVEFKS